MNPETGCENDSSLTLHIDSSLESRFSQPAAPAKASAERSVDSYQQATTAVQATPFAPRRALEQPIRPGAVITLGQATAAQGRADRQTVGIPWLRAANLSSREGEAN